MSSVPRRNAHTRAHPCRICGGADQDPRGQGKRCSGYLSTDELYEHCSREEHAGAIEQAATGLYPHRLNGSCKCGVSHGPELPSSGMHATIEATYDYKSESGALLFQVVRRVGKKFSQRVPDGAGGWIGKLEGVRRVPYHLPELLAADPGRTVYLVEGEKDVESLERIGEVATTTAQGAQSWRLSAAEAAKALAGRNVVVIRDKDDNGMKYALAAEATLRPVAASVRIVECPAHKDVSDHLEAGGTLAELVPMARLEPKPEKPAIAVLPAWKAGLLYKISSAGVPTDKLRPIAANAIQIFTGDPRWAGVLAYDEFAETIVTRKLPPWRACDGAPGLEPGDWSDEDTVRAQAWLADAYALDLGLEPVISAVKVAAHTARFHPVRDWLNSLQWDGQRRVRTWLHDVMGCEDSAYVREVGSCFLVGAVARVMRPGCKLDTVLILEGEQGVGKSSCIRALAGDEWFLEMSVTDVANKDGMQVLKRKWIAELPEIDGLSKTEAAHVKAYFSKQVDSYRPSYGKGSRDFPRQTVFAGSTNKDQYLPDETGGRRFHPVRCRRGNVSLARELREQLWAEAVDLYHSGVEWHVSDPALLHDFRSEQAARHKSHPWEERIAAWLDKPIDLPVGKSRRELGVTTADVLEGALKLDVGKWTQKEANEVAACLRVLGWKQGAQSRRAGIRVRLFFPDGSPSLEQPAEAVPDVAVMPSPSALEDAPSDSDLTAALGE